MAAAGIVGWDFLDEAETAATVGQPAFMTAGYEAQLAGVAEVMFELIILSTIGVVLLSLSAIAFRWQ